MRLWKVITATCLAFALACLQAAAQTANYDLHVNKSNFYFVSPGQARYDFGVWMSPVYSGMQGRTLDVVMSYETDSGDSDTLYLLDEPVAGDSWSVNMPMPADTVDIDTVVTLYDSEHKSLGFFDWEFPIQSFDDGEYSIDGVDAWIGDGITSDPVAWMARVHIGGDHPDDHQVTIKHPITGQGSTYTQSRGSSKLWYFQSLEDCESPNKRTFWSVRNPPWNTGSAQNLQTENGICQGQPGPPIVPEPHCLAWWGALLVGFLWGRRHGNP